MPTCESRAPVGQTKTWVTWNRLVFLESEAKSNKGSREHLGFHLATVREVLYSCSREEEKEEKNTAQNNYKKGWLVEKQWNVLTSLKPFYRQIWFLLINQGLSKDHWTAKKNWNLHEKIWRKSRTKKSLKTSQRMNAHQTSRVKSEQGKQQVCLW